MATEIYKGRKIVTRTRHGRVAREVYATVNGQPAAWSYALDGAEAKILHNVRATIDQVDSGPINGGGWGIEWYDPKTVELCPEGLHAQEVGGTCEHPTCAEKNAGPKTPCPKCGTPTGRYRPIGMDKGRPWVQAHRPDGKRKVCEASNMPAHLFAAEAQR